MLLHALRSVAEQACACVVRTHVCLVQKRQALLGIGITGWGIAGRGQTIIACDDFEIVARLSRGCREAVARSHETDMTLLTVIDGGALGRDRQP